jgi:hypothetical protein
LRQPHVYGVRLVCGCTHRCIADNGLASLVAKMPENNIGWGGEW